MAKSPRKAAALKSAPILENGKDASVIRITKAFGRRSRAPSPAIPPRRTSNLDRRTPGAAARDHALYAGGIGSRCAEIDGGACVGADARVLITEIPRQGTGSGRTIMTHPQRVGDYLEHMAEAVERAIKFNALPAKRMPHLTPPPHPRTPAAADRPSAESAPAWHAPAGHRAARDR